MVQSAKTANVTVQPSDEGELTLSAAPTTAFIYDREVTSHTERMLERIAACRAYADRRGWHVAGVWTDHGEAALHVRKRLCWREMVDAMTYQPPGTKTVCVVADWGRLSYAAADSAELRQMVSRVGGVVCTIDGETDAGGSLSAPTDVVPIPHPAAWAQRASGPYWSLA